MDLQSSEAEELLENCWFFGNTKTRMLRCYSDPSSSSSYRQEQTSPGKSYEETLESIIQKLPSLLPGSGLERTNPNHDTEDLQDDFSMGKLIRQASLSNSNSTRTGVVAKDRSILKLERIKTRNSKIRLKTQKISRKELNPNVVSITPGLQEEDKMEEYDRERLYLSVAWSSTPPVGEIGSTDDIKARIKFWARAVASNVRQEC